MTNNSYAVIAPTGGFGNHTRWLLLLDNRFSVNSVIADSNTYHTFKGGGWPTYNDYVAGNINNVSDSILQEITDTVKPLDINFTNLDTKTTVIKKYVYPTDRSYHNWLRFEWAFRNLFNDLIYFDHLLEKQFNKAIILTVDPELAYRSYFKFNSYLNNESKERFLGLIDHMTNQNILFAEENNIPYLLVDSTVLWNSNLDFNFYKTIIDFFELSNNYDTANYVHSLWFHAHLRSERDLVDNVLKLYKY